MSAAYDVPDHMLDDIDEDARDARDLELEAKRAAAWDELLSDDGDIAPVIDWLTEHTDDVLPLLIAYHNGQSIAEAAERLATRLHGLADAYIEESL
tara:strand:+ start:316 stop:603 length:288 start_codon:yes stop_codon:yes gene_type:complete